MSEVYDGIPNYIPEICSEAKRDGNHFNCFNPCKHIHTKDKYICPCFGKNGSGWIPCTIEKEQELINDVKRWNKCREKIPCKDAFSLKGIKHFRIIKLWLDIEQFPMEDVEKVKKNMVRLFKNGDMIRFSEDYGVGDIKLNDNGTYTVTKWHYGKGSNPVKEGTLDDVFSFLFVFWSSPEPYDYDRAMKNALS